MTNLDGQTLDILHENIKKLRELFPEVAVEDKIDFDKLKQILGEYVDDNKERYNFTWNGKGRALRLSQTPSLGTLRPCPKESKNWDTTENLYIEGDNLEVLKLLQKSYHNKIKMIYIDPPYNTGGDFVYPDDFSDSLENYKKITGQIDDDGNRISSNAETNGRYHTDWLNMMYPRLRLARNLLTKDGVIFISIDDNELINLKKICDEVFSEENYINTISLLTKNTAGASGGGEDKRLKKNIEYILIYGRDYSEFNRFNNVYVYTELSELIQQYIKEESSWKYTSVLVDPGEKIYIGATVDGEGNDIKIYSRKNPIIKSINQMAKEDGISEKEAYKKYGVSIFQTTNAQSSIRTRVIDSRKKFEIVDDLISIEYVPKSGKNKGKLYEQFYKGDKCRLFVWLRDTSEIIDDVLYKKDAQGTSWDIVGETKNLTKEGSVAFPNGKKPIILLKRLIEMQTSSEDIILDFFSGSATTAHATMQYNAEKQEKRKFIMVQLPESIDTDSLEANPDDNFTNICEIGKERIRRAGDKIKEEAGLTAINLDIGFKVFKLDTSNLKKWQPDYDNLEQSLIENIGNFVDGRSELDVVYEIIIKMGLDLTYPVEETVVGGKKVYSVGFGALMMCLDDEITTDVANGMVNLYNELKPETWKVVFKDNGFKSDSNKTNIKEILKCAGLEEDAFTTI